MSLSVGIQHMIRSDIGSAGVAFTLDTETGFRDAVFITSAYGLGEAVVQGSVNPDEFYILASREFVAIPEKYAAEMRAYDTRVGEFRAHYAGFFDPGFGLTKLGAKPTRAVLELSLIHI